MTLRYPPAHAACVGKAPCWLEPYRQPPNIRRRQIIRTWAMREGVVEARIASGRCPRGALASNAQLALKHGIGPLPPGFRDCTEFRDRVVEPGGIEPPTS